MNQNKHQNDAITKSTILNFLGPPLFKIPPECHKCYIRITGYTIHSKLIKYTEEAAECGRIGFVPTMVARKKNSQAFLNSWLFYFDVNVLITDNKCCWELIISCVEHQSWPLMLVGGEFLANGAKRLQQLERIVSLRGNPAPNNFYYFKFVAYRMILKVFFTDNTNEMKYEYPCQKYVNSTILTWKIRSLPTMKTKIRFMNLLNFTKRYLP